MNEGQAHQTHDVAEARDPQDVAIDPVCGMEVNKATARHRYEHGSQPYFFCGARCREKFVAAPESYLAKREAPAAANTEEHHLHLPHAPGDPAGGTGKLPDLRHGTGASGRNGRGRTECRAARHDPPLLDWLWSCPCRSWRWRWAGTSQRLVSTTWCRRACPSGCNSRSRLLSCCGPAGRSSSAPGPPSCIAA